MKTVLFVNPVAGQRKAVGMAFGAADLLIEAGHQVQTIIGTDAADAGKHLDHAMAGGVDNVIVVGGDGQIHSVLGRVAHSEVTLGIIPAGTGNDTARSLAIPRRSLAAAVDVIIAGETRSIDLAKSGDAYVSTVVASGFDSKVNERANAMKWPRGNSRYNIAMLAELRVFRPLAFRLNMDGTSVDTEAMLVAVGNGPSFGGGMRICEGAELDDGFLDVVIVEPISKRELVKVFPRVYRGTHRDHPAVVHHLVRNISIDSHDTVAYGDGERLGPLPRDVSIVPASLRVFVP